MSEDVVSLKLGEELKPPEQILWPRARWEDHKVYVIWKEFAREEYSTMLPCSNSKMSVRATMARLLRQHIIDTNSRT